MATKMFVRLVEQLKQRDGITEELKALHQMEWVRQMNAIRSEAETVVMKSRLRVFGSAITNHALVFPIKEINQKTPE